MGVSPKLEPLFSAIDHKLKGLDPSLESLIIGIAKFVYKFKIAYLVEIFIPIEKCVHIVLIGVPYLQTGNFKKQL